MKVSVILTSYNHEKFLKRSIESVLSQSYQNFEFIIVDDCSTDESWKIIAEYKEKFPNLITIRHDHNWGTGVVEDTVLNYTEGEYIAIHHSDDMWEPDKLEKQVDFLENHQEYAAVFTNAQAIDDEDNEYVEEGFYHDLFTVENRSRGEWLRYFFEHGNCLCHPSIVIRKSVYIEDNFFKKGMKQIPDFVKWISICLSHNIYVLPERLVKFRVHREGKNTSGMRANTQIRSTIELYWMLNEYRKITDRDEFLKVFPEAEEYCIGEVFVPEYALGRICTRPNVQPYTRLFGDSLLFEVLNDPYKAKIVYDQYHYGALDLIRETGKYDVFGILPKAFEQTRALYLDYGNGWDTSNCITEKYTIDDAVEFEMTAQFDLPASGSKIRVRFDPAEGIMVRVKLHNISVNGKQVTTYVGENAIRSIDGEEVFINLDPIYSFEIELDMDEEKKVNVSISGEIFRLTDDEISSIVMDDLYAKRDKIYNLVYQVKDYEYQVKDYEYQVKDYEYQVKDYEKKQNELNTELNRVNDIIQQQKEELDAIKNTRIYKMAKKVYSLFVK